MHVIKTQRKAFHHDPSSESRTSSAPFCWLSGGGGGVSGNDGGGDGGYISNYSQLTSQESKSSKTMIYQL